MPGFEDRYVNVGGIKTRYWQAGTVGSPVTHGIGCSVLDWELNIATLASQHRVYALDMLGYGLTEKPSNETYTGPRLTRFVLDFLTAQKIQRAHFAGFSLGGRVISLDFQARLAAGERLPAGLVAGSQKNNLAIR
jgi:pimeloyl-ACP methyl ester carboxylesterase